MARKGAKTKPAFTDFGRRLQQAIGLSEMTAAEVAERAGVQPSVLTQWAQEERANKPANKVLAVARVLGVRLEWLLQGEGVMVHFEHENKVFEVAGQSFLLAHSIDPDQGALALEVLRSSRNFAGSEGFGVTDWIADLEAEWRRRRAAEKGKVVGEELID